ncbi:hypothetical protein LS684_02475 [Cytobacillus spongiae]|uniref:hypothetical protein n=1 Tax=Cytobacillus spongiae TaxID=2901381 RepID=UPI001F202C4B|nr:hypothetical protein [Cytobacillus spongiae]UII56371.1 hypothetical protein LS684_02475 [Cytobacillus spongiae]
MRTWRVGTFSMGASLLFLGIYLFLSQIFEFDLLHVMMSWWPIILVVLGIEILAFLFLSKSEKPLLRYDILSILFVSVIGTIGIGFAILQSIGLTDKVEEVLNREQRSFELPGFEMPVDRNVKKIVIQTNRYPITIEGTTEQEVSMFGVYEAVTGKKEKLLEEWKDYMVAEKKGDTIYLQLKGMPSNSYGMFSEQTELTATILIPTHVALEVDAFHNSLTIKPRSIRNDWNIDRASDLTLMLDGDSDVNVAAVGVDFFEGQEMDGTIDNEEGSPSDSQKVSSQPRDLLIGKGTHQLSISNTSSVRYTIK